MDTVTQRGTKVRAVSGRNKATKETAVKAAQLSSSNALSPLGRKGRENNLLQMLGTYSDLHCPHTWQEDKLHSSDIT